ncbi:hypothetical protein [Nannocystis radixulma]|uniref:Uncharacterized protein n=1 Tax=Nannocystis radixulma TaxID=2995305 RepID=A0ABT5BNX3_9BACT|nr:hypothetical protein [Nannocystis radixulma]MDC0675872.1 hypothetical protein [Nannocystis radixulma]
MQGVALAMAMVTADAPAGAASSKDERVAAAYQQFEKQRHVEAALEFEGLWRDFKEPRFLFNAAVTRYTARHYAHAVAYLNEYLALAEVKGADRDEAKAQLEVARREVTSVQVRVQAEGVSGEPTVTARWVSEFASDIRPELPVPLAPSGTAQGGVIQLDPGTWVLRAQAPGAEPAEVQVKVAAGAAVTAELALKPVPQETGPKGQPAPQPGMNEKGRRVGGLAMIGQGAAVTAIGIVVTAVAQAKDFGPALKAGPDKCGDWAALTACSVDLREGAQLRGAGTGLLGAGIGLAATGPIWFVRNDRSRRVAWIVQASVGGAALIGGIVGVALSASGFNEANTSPEATWQSVSEGVKGPATIYAVTSAITGLGVGLAAGAGLGLGVTRGKKSQYAKALRLGGGPGRAAFGLTLSGRF